MKNKNASRRGFTLVEILIVVLILGVLMSIAVPMYQGSIDKSRWAKLRNPVRTFSSAQQISYMANGAFASTPDILDVSPTQEIEDNTFLLGDGTYMMESKTATQTSLRGTTDKLPGVRLFYNISREGDNFDERLFCEAVIGDNRANRLCEKLLQGEAAGTSRGYTQYLLNGDGPCVWSAVNSRCFATEEERCEANGMSFSAGMCGYLSSYGTPYHEINEGGICKAVGGKGCLDYTINEGGLCLGETEQSCLHAVIHGGICEATGKNSCGEVTVDQDGVCNARGGSCGGTYTGGTCNAFSGGCNGTYREGSICNSYVAGSCRGTYSDSVCNAYENGCGYGSSFNAGSVCNAIGGGCNTTSFHDGAVCNGKVASSCNSAFYEGAVCYGQAAGACSGNKTSFQTGSRCVAQVAGSCGGPYQGGCCEGDHCPATAPRC